MLPNLRSVVTQLNRGGRPVSTFSRRFFLSPQRRIGQRRSERELRYELEEDTISFPGSVVYGICGVIIWESIQTLDYIYACQRALDEGQSLGEFCRFIFSEI